MRRPYSPQILWSLIVIIVLGVGIGVYATIKSNRPGEVAQQATLLPGDAKPATSIPTAGTPAIPESSQTAKDFINQASTAANQGHYRQAVSILDDAIKQIPNDQNLQLTREYYQNLAAQYDQ